jgi:hypothetical protein
MALSQALQQFKAALSPSERAVLTQCLQEAKQVLPSHWMPWFLLDTSHFVNDLILRLGNVYQQIY